MEKYLIVWTQKFAGRLGSCEINRWRRVALADSGGLIPPSVQGKGQGTCKFGEVKCGCGGMCLRGQWDCKDALRGRATQGCRLGFDELATVALFYIFIEDDL